MLASIPDAPQSKQVLPELVKSSPPVIAISNLAQVVLQSFLDNFGLE
jgi:hypothetical protein